MLTVVSRKKETSIGTIVSRAGETLHNGFPVQYLGFGPGSEGLEDWGWFFDDGFELLEEAFGGRRCGGTGGGHDRSHGCLVVAEEVVF